MMCVKPVKHWHVASMAALHDSSSWTISVLPLAAAMCSGVRLLKEQEMRSKCQRRNTTEHQQSIFNQQCRCSEEIPEVSRIDGGVA